MDNQVNGSRWIRCPICGSKTRTKVYDDTVLIKFPLYCPKCKKEILVNVVQLKMVVSNERPDVKFCVSDFRQSQEWYWKAGQILAGIP